MSTYPALKILQPQGILDAEQGKGLYREVTELLDADIQWIVIDCSTLTFVDSSGLGLLVRMLRSGEHTVLNCSHRT